jgi:hypothetical protein
VAGGLCGVEVAEAVEGAAQGVSPWPGSGQVQDGAPAGAGEAGGDVEEAVAQAFGLTPRQVAVKQKELCPREEVLGDEDEFQPGRVHVQAGEGEVAKPRVLGVLHPELVHGIDAVSLQRRRELQELFARLIRTRGCPLHLANLWNALWFQYDLDHGGYQAATLESSNVPKVRMERQGEALPVGAFIGVHTRVAAGDLTAEVVYKEGAAKLDDDGYIDPAVSGAPAELEDGQPVVRERFVIDLDAFGPSPLTEQQYTRVLRNGRWLDEHGHLIMNAVYNAGDVELSDVDFYINYLLARHGEGLLGYCFREPPTAGDVREARVPNRGAGVAARRHAPLLPASRLRCALPRGRPRARRADADRCRPCA